MSNPFALRLGSVALLLLAAASLPSACTLEGHTPSGLTSFSVRIVEVNGRELPPADAPLPANRGDLNEVWKFEIEARDATGRLDPWDGSVRLSIRPGTVLSVLGEGAAGRNITLVGGRASGLATVTAVYGPARLWVQDLGYTPITEGTPGCADGFDDDGDELIDFPSDPGCAFADDDTEEGGSYAIGVSGPVAYELPSLADVQGSGSTTPYPFESVEVQTTAPARLVVTRVARDGFNVTDLADQASGHNHMFAFSFSTPPRMRVCDRVTYLAGTVNEFFGFTELSFPSFKLEYPILGEEECEVPEPVVLDGTLIGDPLAMESAESGLVRIEGFRIGKYFGPAPAVNNVFDAGQSSCDLNGDGQVDFESDVEAACSDACSADPDCVEWTAYSARGSFKLHNEDNVMILGQTGAAPGFDPVLHKGEVITSLTGSLRNFSGGSLNWTIEARCQDDLVCSADGCCTPERCPGDKPLLSKEACVLLRTLDDNDVISD